MGFNTNNKEFQSPEDAILIVDDEEDIRALLKRYLASQFPKILEAKNKKEALDILLKQEIPLALVDIGLPDGSGLDLLREMRKISPATIPIILTGNPDRDLVKRALQLGAHDFLDKPCEPEILKHTITRAHELFVYKNQMQDILELLICEYGKFELTEYQQLTISQKAKLLDMIKGILSLKILRRKNDIEVDANDFNL